ncbi:ATP-binding protein, partial [Nonomuraea sp. NPDC050691]|uniref:ATP-binding protein n=1 Tax=Nonomuraea sp. NPDC050691 TaxID=3155661 RepID=UPI0033C31ADC
MLYGRADEQARIDALLASARAGHGGAVVVTGETGIGKTALLDHVAPAGFLVLRALGIEAESELPFAALYPLLGPFLDRAARLPAAQAEALREAVEQAPDRSRARLAGPAVLGLLADLAAERPVLCVVDDAHRLDGASADALLFAARRLGGERIAMIFTAGDGVPGRPRRAGFGEAAGIPRMPLAALDEAAACELLTGRAPGLPLQVRRRVAEEAAGNPLALAELSDALTPEQRAGRLGPHAQASGSG